jgi:hypothetical protein
MKTTLTHIGVVSLGRMLAIWTFVIGCIFLFVTTLFMLFAMLLGMMGNDPGAAFGGGLIGLVMSLVFGVVGLVFGAIAAFIAGAIMAIVYNIILGVGGGIDIDLRERK